MVSALWQIREVAEFWGVSVSRAQAILAKHGVKSGYDPVVVRSIPRLAPGARTDLKPALKELRAMGKIIVTIQHGDTTVTKEAEFTSGNARFVAYEAAQVGQTVLGETVAHFGDPKDAPANALGK